MKLTPAQKAAETRRKKVQAMAAAMGLEDDLKRKTRKPRKPMSEEQKAAAAERLKKAREAKAPAASSTYPQHLLDLPEDAELSISNVRSWIKNCQDEMSLMKGWDKSSDAKERSAYLDLETYISNMQTYLRIGEWLDFRYGEKREKIMVRRCVAKAYDRDGNVKRNVGTYYEDLGLIWTKEMDARDREQRILNQK